jgi:uncharacterized membrane protein YphA (DoxX/SURF4 family)
MKKTKTLYWIFTGLFAAFMAFTAIPDILMAPDAMVFITQLGYPEYFVPFIGVAKILGAIAIIIPGFPKIKEWAYAGLAYDLIGAIYSVIATAGLQPQMIFILLPVTFLILSYRFHHLKMKEENGK